MESIEAALADLKLQDPPNYTATAKKFGVDRTTLSRRHRGVTMKKGHHPNSYGLLSPEQRKTLITYINQLNDRGLPPTPRMVRRFAFDISGKSPGNGWVNRFIKSTHGELSSCFLSGFDLNRKRADNLYDYTEYFRLVSNPIKLRNQANYI